MEQKDSDSYRDGALVLTLSKYYQSVAVGPLRNSNSQDS